MSRSAEHTRQAIVDAAYLLLRRKGFSRVSLDEIAAAAAVTKRTLYHHFSSKDALVAAVLEAQSALALAAFQTFGRKLSGTPEKIVDELFAELSRWSGKPRWPGSGFTRLVHELADLPGHPAREIARRHKAALEAHLAELLAGAGLAGAPQRSREIYLLAEGAMALILIHEDQAYADAARDAARRLVRSESMPA
jgi:AcrR family transcriptional regulator